MAKLTVLNLPDTTLEPRSDESVLLAAVRTQTTWKHNCGGRGRCTTCRFECADGSGDREDAFGPLAPVEAAFRESGKLLAGFRLACQVKLSADVEVRIPEATRVAGVSYLD